MFEIRRLEHFRGKTLSVWGRKSISTNGGSFAIHLVFILSGFAHEYPVFEGEIRRLGEAHTTLSYDRS